MTTHNEDFPYGVRCADCDKVLHPASDDPALQPWARTIERDEDNTTVQLVVCMDCWLVSQEDLPDAQ